MLFSNKKGSLLGTILCVLVFFAVLNSCRISMAQDKCTKQLVEAEQKYYAGRFDETIGLAMQCVNSSDITEADKLQAYRLIGLAYIAKDYLEQARAAVKKLLELFPTYEPDPDQDPPPFTNMVKEMKLALEAEEEKRGPAVPKEPEVQKRGRGKTWLFIGGGVVAGVVAVLVAGSGGNGDGNGPKPLPFPPDPPNQ